MKNLESNSGMVQKKNPQLSELRKQLAKQVKPSKLIALKRTLTKKATKTQLKPKMHTIKEFTEATSMSLSDKFPFGKYKDKTLRYIIKTDPMWLSWILNNSDGRIRLCTAAATQMQTFMAAEAAAEQEGFQQELEEGNTDGISYEDTF